MVVVDTAGEAVVKSIELDSPPDDLTVTPDRRHLYVSDPVDNSVVDPALNHPDRSSARFSQGRPDEAPLLAGGHAQLVR